MNSRRRPGKTAPAGNTRQVIGGEFELNTLQPGPVSNLDALAKRSGTWTSSGRAAFGLVLRQLKNEGVSHIEVPSYLCGSLLQPIQALGLPFSFYAVGETLEAGPRARSGTAVLLVHYFGWPNRARAELAGNRSIRLIEDNSHFFLSDAAHSPTASGHVFFSARKFGPVPLGGWCDIRLPQPQGIVPLEMEAVGWRSLAARLARGAYLKEADNPVDAAAEQFYLDAFAGTEHFLDTHPLQEEVPSIALQIAAGLNWEEIKKRRRENWTSLRRLLPDWAEPLHDSLPPGVTPLGYVVKVPDRDRLRAALAARRIFCPVHWKLPGDVIAEHFPGSAKLAASCLTIPIDQRYRPDDMARISEAFHEFA